MLIPQELQLSLDISINNVPLEEGETGCEFVVILPQGYDYNFLKAV